MGKAWAERSPEARKVFDEADRVLGDRLGVRLSTLCFEGPVERLNQTDAAQPALYTAAIASWRGLLAQWGIIRMFEMTPRQLLRWGVAVAAFGNLLVAFAPDYWAVVAGYAISSLGFGFARPGFTAGSSLAVNSDEQARVAGAIAAVNGVNVVLAPLFVMLYEHIPSAPFLLNMTMMLAMLLYAFRNPQLRNADPKPATRADTAIATLEKSDEGAA